MPIKSDVELLTVTYNSGTHKLSWTCVAAGENRYDGKLELSTDGFATSIEPDTYDVWQDSAGEGTIAAGLAPGTYAARLTNGDGEVSNVLDNAVIVSGTLSEATRPRMFIGVAVAVGG